MKKLHQRCRCPRRQLEIVASERLLPVAISPVAIAGSPLSLHRGSRAADLIGVVVSMATVDAQPVLDRVGATLAMRAGSPPLLLAETPQDGGRRRPRGLEGGQRWLDRPVWVEPADKRLLVVPEQGRRVFRNQQSQPDGRSHLTIGQVVDNLSWAPLAWRLARLQLRRGDLLQCR